MCAEFPPAGGVGTVMLRLCNEARTADCAVTAITEECDLTPFPTLRALITAVPKTLGPFALLPEVVRHLRTQRYAVVIANDVKATFTIGLIAAWWPALLKGVHIATILHGSEYERFIYRPKHLRALIYPRAYRRGIERSDALFFFGHRIRRRTHLQNRRLGLGAPPEVLLQFPRTSSSARTPRSVSEARPLRIVTAARLDLMKGFPDMIEALTQLRAGGTPFHWHVYGSGKDADEITARVNGSPIAGLSTFHGFVPSDALLAAYANMDVFLLPSLYREGFGLAWLEARDAGLPVIGRPRGELPYLIDENDGLLSESPAEIASYLAALARGQITASTEARPESDPSQPVSLLEQVITQTPTSRPRT